MIRLNDITNIPNAITFSRVPLAFCWLAFYHDKRIQLAIIVLIILTDMVDGYLARRLHLITDFGKVFDPICDKVISLFAFFCFYFLGNISLMYLIIFLLRDIFIFFALPIYFLFFRYTKIKWHARFFGKITTALQFLAILVFTLSLDFINIFLLLIFIFSIISIFDYVIFFVKKIKILRKFV